MQKLFLLLALAACTVQAQDNAVTSKASVNFWRVSVTALGAANAMDIQSSWGKHELNSTLAGSNGTFGVQGALIKLGLQGSLVGIEYLVTRRHPSARLYKALGVINFGAAAGFASAAAHNYTVPGRQ
ncbi:MAG TPA: hypothetical protein VG456_13545 [Candidatus Sulfopaludibacter sp.]|jgi:hypothetical protein|nr:hypothetical protein [Candidatus Sulfopaludibacter sp.]